MSGLTLGPLLRYTGPEQATIWAEVDRAGTVGIELEGREFSARTFGVEGHHFALVELDGLEPEDRRHYKVTVDGKTVWPPRDYQFPDPSVTTPAPEQLDARVVFGSCRISLPNRPPYVLDQDEHRLGHGVDALRTYALQAARAPAEELPRCLLLLGDQIYAEQPSPQLLELIRRKPRPADAPEGELADFGEYALAYREAWSEPAIRWLLSTAPTAMIFDDHEIHPQWKISQDWLDDMRAEPWYDRHISGGLMAYWIYQHLGNLSPAELDENDLYQRVRAQDEAGPLLRREMRNADRQAGHSRWSHCRDVGRSRLIVIDSRAGRELGRGERKMIGDAEWDWIVERATGTFEHLMIASSVPFVMTPAFHHFEAFGEALADGAWGEWAARAGEKLRRAAVFDHWASFGRSFARLEELIESVATGGHAPSPASLILLSGDVHHCYLAEVGVPGGKNQRSPVWQAVCSAYRKQLLPKERLSMKLGNSRAGEVLGRALARATRAREPRLPWRIVEPPTYVNQVAMLELGRARARITVESSARADWRVPRLRRVFSRDLTEAVRSPAANRSSADRGTSGRGQEVDA